MNSHWWFVAMGIICLLVGGLLSLRLVTIKIKERKRRRNERALADFSHRLANNEEVGQLFRSKREMKGKE